jgi:hypothetical protein
MKNSFCANYLTAGESTLGESTTGESTAGESTTGASTAGVSTTGESVAGVVVVLSPQATKVPKMATKNNFFIFLFLIVIN